MVLLGAAVVPRAPAPQLDLFSRNRAVRRVPNELLYQVVIDRLVQDEECRASPFGALLSPRTRPQ